MSGGDKALACYYIFDGNECLAYAGDDDVFMMHAQKMMDGVRDKLEIKPNRVYTMRLLIQETEKPPAQEVSGA